MKFYKRVVKSAGMSERQGDPSFFGADGRKNFIALVSPRANVSREGGKRKLARVSAIKRAREFSRQAEGG